MPLELWDLRRIVKQCDPLRPLEAGDPLYVPLDDVRGTVSCVEALLRTVALAEDESCQLFTGFPGTGKTTELKRLARRLRDAGISRRTRFTSTSRSTSIATPRSRSPT
jgi:hypothetical protein